MFCSKGNGTCLDFEMLRMKKENDNGYHTENENRFKHLQQKYKTLSA